MDDKKYDNAFEISIRDLCISVLQQWRVIICVSVIFSIFVGVYGMFLKNDEDTSSFSLTDTQKKNVESIARTIETYETLKATRQEYNEHSIYQNLNAYMINTVELKYYIDNSFSETYPNVTEVNNLPLFVQAYGSELSDLKTYEKITDTAYDISPFYYSELVDVDYSMQEDGVLVIKVYGEDESMAVFLANFIKKAVEERTSEIITSFGEHTIMLVKESKMLSRDALLYEEQQNNITSIAMYDRGIANTKATLTSNELEYLNQVLSNEDGDLLATNGDVERKIDIEYLLLGAGLGLVLAIVFLSAKYLFSKRIRSSKELETLFGLQHIGSLRLSINEKKNKIDLWLLSLKDSSLKGASLEDSISILCAKMVLLAQKKEIYTIGFVFESLTEEERKTIAVIKDTLAPNIQIKEFDRFLSKPESFEDFVATENVVLVKKIGKSSYQEMTKERQFCREYGVNILGCITIE